MPLRWIVAEQVIHPTFQYLGGFDVGHDVHVFQGLPVDAGDPQLRIDPIRGAAIGFEHVEAGEAGTSVPKLVEVPDEVAAVPARLGKQASMAQPITEDPQKVYIREQIQMLGKTNPATVAQLIQTWMDEDRRN